MQFFDRSHAHIDTKRREPWLYSEAEMKLIRDAIRTRYSYLPFWYTLFYEGEKTGTPPMRPTWYEFPEDEEQFAVEGQHMVGAALLVRPVFKAGASHALVTFPGDGSEVWYDTHTHEKVDQKGGLNVRVTLDRIPGGDCKSA